jgi:hypothetical protein
MLLPFCPTTHYHQTLLVPVLQRVLVVWPAFVRSATQDAQTHFTLRDVSPYPYRALPAVRHTNNLLYVL